MKKQLKFLALQQLPQLSRQAVKSIKGGSDGDFIGIEDIDTGITDTNNSDIIITDDLG